MLDRGIALAPGAYEAISLAAHGDEEIEATIAACAEVAATL